MTPVHLVTMDDMSNVRVSEGDGIVKASLPGIADIHFTLAAADDLAEKISQAVIEARMSSRG